MNEMQVATIKSEERNRFQLELNDENPNWIRINRTSHDNIVTQEQLCPVFRRRYLLFDCI